MHERPRSRPISAETAEAVEMQKTLLDVGHIITDVREKRHCKHIVCD